MQKFVLPDEDDRHVLAADALLSQLVREHPTEMLAAHRATVRSLRGATDESTLAALRRANASKTAGLLTVLLDLA